MSDGFYELPARIAQNAKAVHLLWDNDVDAYIEESLGRKWQLQQNDEFYGQNTLVEFEVWPDPEATEKVTAWLSSAPARFPGRSPDSEGEDLHNAPSHGETWNETVEISTETILNELCNRGLLPEHTMYVHVWW